MDMEFRRLVFPYSEEEYGALEQQILRCGCSAPIAVWYGYILQGFEQYEICRTHHIAFEIRNVSFRVREEAVSLICRNELADRYLPENQRRYLIGKRYNADSIIGVHNAVGTNQFKERVRRDLFKSKDFYESSTGRTKKRLAEEYHLDRCTITRYSIYAQAIDYIASVKSEMANQILAGKMKTSMEAVMDCYGKTEDEMVKLLTASRERTGAKMTGLEKEKAAKDMTVKDMPAFDPDAEIDSLALTIPSWISSIDRTRSAAQFALLTVRGRKRLEQELYQLQKAAQIMLDALKEVH
ncbi:MAG: hypothetical protein NC337_08820 [Roseburia sp.]|nr:hypothetical protein [Roseburia sp.]